MTGLEDVKKQVLSIRNKVDTSIRQGTDLKGERFNISMLGNPGTGAFIKDTFASFCSDAVSRKNDGRASLRQISGIAPGHPE